MRRWVHVGAILANHLVEGGTEAVLRDGIGLFGLGVGRWRHLGLAEARPDWGIGCETVGQIDEFLSRNDLVGTIEVAGGARRGVQTAADDGGENKRHQSDG